MNVGEIRDLYYNRYLKILSKSHEPSGECNLEEFSNIMSGVSVTADRLAQLVERRTTVREVSGSSPRPDQDSGS